MNDEVDWFVHFFGNVFAPEGVTFSCKHCCGRGYADCVVIVGVNRDGAPHPGEAIYSVKERAFRGPAFDGLTLEQMRRLVSKIDNLNACLDTMPTFEAAMSHLSDMWSTTAKLYSHGGHCNGGDWNNQDWFWKHGQVYWWGFSNS